MRPRPTNLLALVMLIAGCQFPPLPLLDETDAAELDAAGSTDATDATEIDSSVMPPPGMVLVPAGQFRMGCNVPAGCGTVPDALPFRDVTLSRFAIDRLEVSRAQYAACVAAGACIVPPLGGLDPSSYLPVQVTYASASAYCTWLQKRLPSEAEWEKAARSHDERFYPWGDIGPTCTEARFVSCTPNMMDPVDSHPGGASPYGALNMSGNQWEWVADWYAGNFYQTGTNVNPTGPATGTERVVRGGDYLDGATGGTPHLMSWYRRKFAPSDNSVGFRCAVGI